MLDFTSLGKMLQCIFSFVKSQGRQERKCVMYLIILISYHIHISYHTHTHTHNPSTPQKKKIKKFQPLL